MAEGYGNTNPEIVGTVPPGEPYHGGYKSAGIDPEYLRVFGDMIKASEEKTKSQIETIETRIESRLEKLDRMPEGSAIWKAALTAAGSATIAILGVGLTVLAIGGDRFDGGVGLGTVVGDKFSENRLAIEENSRRDAETNENVNRVLERLDQIINRIDGDARTK